MTTVNAPVGQGLSGRPVLVMLVPVVCPRVLDPRRRVRGRRDHTTSRCFAPSEADCRSPEAKRNTHTIGSQKTPDLEAPLEVAPPWLPSYRSALRSALPRLSIFQTSAAYTSKSAEAVRFGAGGASGTRSPQPPFQGVIQGHTGAPTGVPLLSRNKGLLVVTHRQQLNEKMCLPMLFGVWLVPLMHSMCGRNECVCVVREGSFFFTAGTSVCRLGCLTSGTV